MIDSTTHSPRGAGVEHHVSWAELFFDLVVVAGVAALAHVLATELDARALGLFTVLFLAFWLTWTTFMLHANITADRTRVLRLLVGTFGLGVMAASVPGVAHTVLQDGPSRPATVFAAAYVATRLFGARSWRQGEVLVDFPVVQLTVGVLPFIASIWVHGPWQVALWALGVGLDLVLILVISGSTLIARLQTHATTRATHLRRGHRERTPVVQRVSVDTEHLAERLGLFVIIVLGESVVQIVNAASQAPAGAGVLVSGLASFILLAGLFGLSVVLGHAGLPRLRAGRIPTRAALGLHCLVTGVIATVAVSLTAAVTDGAEPLTGPDRWLLCGAVAAYFALGVLTGVISRASDLLQTVSRTLTGILAPLVLGAFAVHTGARTLVIWRALIVLAHLFFERRLGLQDAHGTTQ